VTAEARLAEFRADLPALGSMEIFHKFVYVGGSVVLTDGLHAGLKAEVAGHFHVHVNNVVMVGSAKYGFSIKPSRRYGFFGDQSDIDLAIVDTPLFEAMWKDVYDYERGGGLWDRAAQFKDYFFQGWIRPDKLPPAQQFARAADWWEFFRALTASEKYGPYRITAGLYHSWHFLESYQCVCIDQCKQIG
jgi:hypothetical protein